MKCVVARRSSLSVSRRRGRCHGRRKSALPTLNFQIFKVSILPVDWWRHMRGKNRLLFTAARLPTLLDVGVIKISSGLVHGNVTKKEGHKQWHENRAPESYWSRCFSRRKHRNCNARVALQSRTRDETWRRTVKVHSLHSKQSPNARTSTRVYGSFNVKREKFDIDL